MEQSNGFNRLLVEEAGLDEETVQKLGDAGFDDIESLELAGIDQLTIIGIKNPEEVYKQIKAALKDSSHAIQGRDSHLLA